VTPASFADATTLKTVSLPAEVYFGHITSRGRSHPSGRLSITFIVEGGETVMRDDEREDNTIYKVVVNHEEQYSIWPADRENALGWSDAGKSGTKAECLAYIEEVWTDMRPLSLRKKMEAEGRP
jgi:MbtH protein